METLIRARFLQAFDFVIAKENLTQKGLCELLGQSAPHISAIRTRTHTSIKASVLGALCSRYRYINPFWILTGEGSMQAIPEDLKAILSRIDNNLNGTMAQLITQLIQIKTPQNLIYKKPSKS